MGPDSQLDFQIVKPKIYWPMVIIISLLLAFLNVFIGADIPAIESFSLSNFFCENGLKIVASMFKVLLYIGLILLVGKKFM